MFAFLKSQKQDRTNSSSESSFKKDKESIPNSVESSAHEPKVSEHPKDTWVFIWNMTADKVGHAAIQVGGSQPKMKDEEPGEYASIHPEGIPSTGITSVLPLPAHLATNLSEDMETLGASKNTSFIDMDNPPKIISEQENPLPPDEVYHFKDLNTAEMSKHIQKTQKKVENGEVGYQLFPNVNVLGFFKDSSAFISHDPVDIEMHRRVSQGKKSNTEVYNCTTLVSEVLNEGGLPIRQSKAKPWGITPNGLSSEISDAEEVIHEGFKM